MSADSDGQHHQIRTDELQDDVRRSVLELALQQVNQANLQAANERITAQAYSGVAAAIALALCVARADAPSGTLAAYRGFDDWWWIPLVLAAAFIAYLVSTFGSKAQLARDPSEIAGLMASVDRTFQYDAYLLSLEAARDESLRPQGMLFYLPAVGHVLLLAGVVTAAFVFALV